jgi:hypothetical protein
MNAPERCRAVGSLSDLVMRHPDLREVFRHFSQQFVPVAMNTCTIPQDASGELRDDCLVYGLYFVDRKELRDPGSGKAIRQDYFVVWPQTGEMRYYSGQKKSWRKSGNPIRWRPIESFCDEFAGPGECYGCKPRPKRVLPDHWYGARDRGLRRMKPQPVWRIAFDLALAVSRKLPPT